MKHICISHYHHIRGPWGRLQRALILVMNMQAYFPRHICFLSLPLTSLSLSLLFVTTVSQRETNSIYYFSLNLVYDISFIIFPTLSRPFPFPAYIYIYIYIELAFSRGFLRRPPLSDHWQRQASPSLSSLLSMVLTMARETYLRAYVSPLPLTIASLVLHSFTESLSLSSLCLEVWQPPHTGYIVAYIFEAHAAWESTASEHVSPFSTDMPDHWSHLNKRHRFCLEPPSASLPFSLLPQAEETDTPTLPLRYFYFCLYILVVCHIHVITYTFLLREAAAFPETCLRQKRYIITEQGSCLQDIKRFPQMVFTAWLPPLPQPLHLSTTWQHSITYRHASRLHI